MHSTGNGLEVLVLAFLSWLVVVRICNQNCRYAGDLGGRLGLAYSFACGVVRASCPDGYPARGDIGHNADDAQPLLLIECGSFRGRPTGDQPVYSAFDLPLRQ